MPTIRRTHHTLGTTADGYVTLVQRFRFTDVDASRIADVLWTAELVGPDAVFAGKTFARTRDDEGARHIAGFVPAPGFEFDVALRRHGARDFRVEFTQPALEVPYLDGEFLWRCLDVDGGAVFEEQINTDEARSIVGRPLTGPKPSLRRWLFFRFGHGAIMDEMANNLARLLGAG